MCDLPVIHTIVQVSGNQSDGTSLALALAAERHAKAIGSAEWIASAGIVASRLESAMKARHFKRSIPFRHAVLLLVHPFVRAVYLDEMLGAADALAELADHDAAGHDLRPAAQEHFQQLAARIEAGREMHTLMSVSDFEPSAELLRILCKEDAAHELVKTLIALHGLYNREQYALADSRAASKGRARVQSEGSAAKVARERRAFADAISDLNARREALIAASKKRLSVAATATDEPPPDVCSDTCSPTEPEVAKAIRRHYMTVVAEVHPDKLGANLEAEAKARAEARFQAFMRAHLLLQDARARREYLNHMLALAVASPWLDMSEEERTWLRRHDLLVSHTQKPARMTEASSLVKGQVPRMASVVRWNKFNEHAVDLELLVPERALQSSSVELHVELELLYLQGQRHWHRLPPVELTRENSDARSAFVTVDVGTWGEFCLRWRMRVQMKGREPTESPWSVQAELAHLDPSASTTHEQAQTLYAQLAVLASRLQTTTVSVRRTLEMRADSLRSAGVHAKHAEALHNSIMHTRAKMNALVDMRIAVVGNRRLEEAETRIRQAQAVMHDLELLAPADDEAASSKCRRRFRREARRHAESGEFASWLRTLASQGDKGVAARLQERGGSVNLLFQLIADLDDARGLSLELTDLRGCAESALFTAGQRERLGALVRAQEAAREAAELVEASARAVAQLERESEAAGILVGRRVCVHGLADGRDLNGLTGAVLAVSGKLRHGGTVGYVPKGRIAVLLDKQAEPVFLQPQHLRREVRQQGGPARSPQPQGQRQPQPLAQLQAQSLAQPQLAAVAQRSSAQPAAAAGAAAGAAAKPQALPDSPGWDEQQRQAQQMQQQRQQTQTQTQQQQQQQMQQQQQTQTQTQQDHHLPAHWETVVDDASGGIYYWNTLTDQTSWEPPAPQQTPLPPPPLMPSPLMQQQQTQLQLQQMQPQQQTQPQQTQPQQQQPQQTQPQQPQPQTQQLDGTEDFLVWEGGAVPAGLPAGYPRSLAALLRAVRAAQPLLPPKPVDAAAKAFLAEQCEGAESGLEVLSCRLACAFSFLARKTKTVSKRARVDVRGAQRAGVLRSLTLPGGVSRELMWVCVLARGPTGTPASAAAAAAAKQATLAQSSSLLFAPLPAVQPGPQSGPLCVPPVEGRALCPRQTQQLPRPDLTEASGSGWAAPPAPGPQPEPQTPVGRPLHAFPGGPALARPQPTPPTAQPQPHLEAGVAVLAKWPGDGDSDLWYRARVHRTIPAHRQRDVGLFVDEELFVVTYDEYPETERTLLPRSHLHARSGAAGEPSHLRAHEAAFVGAEQLLPLLPLLPLPPLQPQPQERTAPVHIPLPELEQATDGWAVQRLVGRGSGGVEVFAGRLLLGGSAQDVAVKTLLRGGADELIVVAALEDELRTLAKCRHRNVLPLLGYFLDAGPRACLVSPLLPRGSLHEALHLQSGAHRQTRLALTPAARLAIGHELSLGLGYLHAPDRQTGKGAVIHRDVKSANVLLDADLRPVICDAGLSLEMGFVCGRQSVVGTRGYLDPRVLRTRQYDAQSDVYALGVVLLELLTGLPPVEPHREPPLLASRCLPPHCLDATALAALADEGCWQSAPESARTLAEIARQCVGADGDAAQQQARPPALRLVEAQLAAALERCHALLRHCTICLVPYEELAKRSPPLKATMLFPCMHACVCSSCVHALSTKARESGAARQCPICSSPITRFELGSFEMTFQGA